MTIRLCKGVFFVRLWAVRIRLTKENFLIMINGKYENDCDEEEYAQRHRQRGLQLLREVRVFPVRKVASESES